MNWVDVGETAVATGASLCQGIRTSYYKILEMLIPWGELFLSVAIRTPEVSSAKPKGVMANYHAATCPSQSVTPFCHPRRSSLQCKRSQIRIVSSNQSVRVFHDALSPGSLIVPCVVPCAHESNVGKNRATGRTYTHHGPAVGVKSKCSGRLWLFRWGQGPFTSMKCGDTLALVPVNDRFLIRVGPPVCLRDRHRRILFTRMLVTPCPRAVQRRWPCLWHRMTPQVQLPAGR